MIGRKGLASGILAIIIVLFIFGLYTIVSLAGWNMFNSTIQGMDNETIDPTVKTQIDGLSSIMSWGDTLFVMFFVALLVGFMVTSFTISSSNSIYIVLYFIFLIFTSVIAMIISNGWSYLIANPNLAAAAADLPFTTWFMTYLPVLTFFMGVIGGIIFYARKKSGLTGSDSYNIDSGLGGGDFE